MKITRTIIFDCNNDDDYKKIVAMLLAENTDTNKWDLIKEPLLNRVTAIKVEQVDSL